MLNNLMRAHGLQLLNYEPPKQDHTFQEVLNEGNTREEREDHSQDDASSGRSRSPSRRTRRPLEREDNSLRNRVQEFGSKRRRSPSREVSSSPSPRGRKRERERHARKRHKSKRTPSPSSSPSKRSSFSSSSSSDGYSSSGHHKRRRHDIYRAWKRSRKLQKFKEGGKSITFQTYDGSYGATDKVLSFIQQFDAAFGGENFTESSKLRHVAMHFTKAVRQWWASLKTQDTHPRTWKLCRAAIVKPFLTEDAKDEVLTAWKGLKLEKGESIQQYINKFWDLHLKAIVFKKIDFAEQRQQYCAGLTEDIRAYLNDQKPRTIAEVIHRSKVAMKFFPISKGAPKPFERNEKVHGREQVSKDSKGNGSMASSHTSASRSTLTPSPLKLGGWASLKRISSLELWSNVYTESLGPIDEKHVMEDRSMKPSVEEINTTHNRFHPHTKESEMTPLSKSSGLYRTASNGASQLTDANARALVRVGGGHQASSDDEASRLTRALTMMRQGHDREDMDRISEILLSSQSSINHGSRRSEVGENNNLQLVQTTMGVRVEPAEVDNRLAHSNRNSSFGSSFCGSYGDNRLETARVDARYELLSLLYLMAMLGLSQANSLISLVASTDGYQPKVTKGASEETPMLVNYLITRFQQAMANPALQGEVQQQLQAYGFISPHQEERIPEKSLGETSKRGTSKVREGENPYEELRNLLIDDTHQSRRRGHAQPQEPPAKEKERSESPDESMEEDVAPRRRRVQRSPIPTKRKRSPHSPPRRESKKERRTPRRKRRERGHPLLHLRHLLPPRMKVVVIPQGNHQGEDIEDHMLLGEGQTSSKSSKREERASLSLPMMVPLVPQTKY
ncbi:hypothetical protein L7F22_026396 [Adiantum nelumboides]|nr:hypothetical protein [Adiantum nelumboides]